MDYMNFNEQDLEKMFDELNSIVAKLSFEKNEKKCDIIYNQYRELVGEIKDLIIGKVRDLDEARQKAKEIADQVDIIKRLSNLVSDQVNLFDFYKCKIYNYEIQRISKAISKFHRTKKEMYYCR